MRLRSTKKSDTPDCSTSKNHIERETKVDRSKPTIGSSNSKHCMNDEKGRSLRNEEKRQRKHLLLWRQPICTLQYFLLETVTLSRVTIHRLYPRKKLVFGILLSLILCLCVYSLQGFHQTILAVAQKHIVWWGYWVGLGILSSVGLGTGLHTFLLYLGPHIASVTLAAYECQTLDFPEPPYPDEIICPTNYSSTVITLWAIISKVRWEAVMWGAGTAIGELPPYFMARAARLSGQEDEDDEFEEIEELLDEKATHPSDLSLLERLKLGVHSIVQRVGFFGILACASIPNPLFDLAGITCGHFLIPFWTFFGATLIGKAIIKMHIQKLFVIFVFSEHHVENVVQSLRFIPYFGPSLQMPFKNWLKMQKSKLHHAPGTAVTQGGSILAWVFEKVIIVMVIYFVLSIINSMAQSYHKRMCKERHEALKT